MEIKLRNGSKSKIIDVEKSIISLQSIDQSVINNLIEDYNPVVVDNTSLYFVSKTVLDEITLFNKYPELNLLGDIIKLLGEQNDFFNRRIDELSTTEKIYLNILRNISKLEKIIIFKDLFLGLDLNNQKNLIKVINYLKELDYIVIICSSDVNVLYRYSDYSILSGNTLIHFDTTDEIYTNVGYLIKHNFEVPTLSYITYKAKEEKNVKLFYSKDVRDIIKDIYKHV